MLGPHGSWTSRVESSRANVFERLPVHGTSPISMNLAARQQTSARLPDGYSEPSQYPHSRKEPETYSQPASCSEGGNSELAVHRSSSGQPIRQASSRSNVAIGGISTEQRYDDNLEPPSYVSQHHLPGTREPYVAIQHHSYELPSGSSLATNDLLSSKSSGSSHQGGTMLSQPSTGGQFVGIQHHLYELPSGSSLATNDLLSSESSGSSHQGGTMPSQPSTAGLLCSIEERQSEEEEEEEEEEQEPQLKRAKQEESSTLPTEEKQPRSWTSLFTKVWTTLSGGAQKEKETEDSDDSYKSCDDGDETS